eukprot:CAMPEP_0115844550 /NCGR_PEP_ID=MMETSP0287-20121206/8886_1 /TAXON_ID=412157 /ORGANISM="Chrysochromulina rotalis, Strain UIO044" /LENGTH=75 /DNA_ID=CAMNT_0003298279 /DNA_START=62 /DNA_END=289 /DNA_ORIENTATION=-
MPLSFECLEFVMWAHVHAGRPGAGVRRPSLYIAPPADAQVLSYCKEQEHPVAAALTSAVASSPAARRSSRRDPTV